MKTIAKAMILTALAGGVSYAAAMSQAATPSNEDMPVVMMPKSGHPLNVGGKRVVTYYDQVDSACALTVMLAEGKTAENVGDANVAGTRITVSVKPGERLVVDGDTNRSAEFLCAPNGRKMSARTFTREESRPRS